MTDAFILSLAYPETVVSHASERYARLVHYFGIGNRTHIRAGHAAFALIKKDTGRIEYFDFGRYTAPMGFGRVRGQETDFELRLSISAEVENDNIENLNELMVFFATNPQLTHGEGTLYASVCHAINYDLAKKYISKLQNEGLIKYGAFKEDATNCSRFVTDTLIESTLNSQVKNKLIASKKFTPSTLGSVVLSSTDGSIYKVSERGEISEFKSTVRAVNRAMFWDKLKNYSPNPEGKTVPKENSIRDKNAQWLSGIGAGAWFELYDLGRSKLFRFRRVSAEGSIDCDGIYKTRNREFNYSKPYKFVHYSNCRFFHVKQNGFVYKFELHEENPIP